MTPLVVGGTLAAKAQFTHEGKPARVDGAPVWETSDPAVALVTPAADGMTATITAVGPGAAAVTMTAQAGEVALKAAPVDVQVALPLADAAAIVVSVG
jgi:uncharacterized protein YjdB